MQQIQVKAQVEVLRAKLPSVHALQCEDCPRPAQCYDHRYYERPLEVAPVCFSCNTLRGPANDIRSMARKALGLDGHPKTYKPVKRIKKVLLTDSTDLCSILDLAERKEINLALAKANHNQTKTAQLLGITPRSLRYRMDRLRIES